MANEGLAAVTSGKRTSPKKARIFLRGILIALSSLCGIAVFFGIFLILFCTQSVTVEAGAVPDYSRITSNRLISQFCRIDSDLSEIDTSRLGSTDIPIRLFGFIRGYSRLHIADTVKPVITPQNVCVTVGTRITADMFAREIRDNTCVTLEFLTDISLAGSGYDETVSVIAVDEGGNSTVFDARLSVADPHDALEFEQGVTAEEIKSAFLSVFPGAESPELPEISDCGHFTVTGRSGSTAYFAQISISEVHDAAPPVIKGYRDICITVGQPCDFMAGVTAYDAACGEVEVTVDASAVNIEFPGVYPLVYSAADSSGNVARETITVTVLKPARVRLNVTNILQYPALPNGCEVVSLAIALNYAGCPIDPSTLYDDFMPKSRFYKGDPWTAFVGNARGDGLGCYAPCVVTTGNAYLASVGSQKTVSDVSGQSLSYYEDLVCSGTPVIIWGTVRMNCNPSVCWKAKVNGKQINWLTYSHCMVLIGYTETSYIFCDPLRGIVEYEKSRVERSSSSI